LASSDVDTWLRVKAGKETKKKKQKNKKDDPRQIAFDAKLNLDEVQDLPDCSRQYEFGKLFLPDWLLSVLPGECRRFHSWYLQFARLGVKTITARYPSEVFHTLGSISFCVVDFAEFQNMFRLGEMDTTCITIWCL